MFAVILLIAGFISLHFKKYEKSVTIPGISLWRVFSENVNVQQGYTKSDKLKEMWTSICVANTEQNWRPHAQVVIEFIIKEKGFWTESMQQSCCSLLNVITSGKNHNKLLKFSASTDCKNSLSWKKPFFM